MDFPFFNYHPELIYFDNAATTQKPKQVIDALSDFYGVYNAPVHRGIYSLAEEATVKYEAVRAAVADYLGAHPDEIVFTKGTTEGINLVASAWAGTTFKHGDEVIITELEHHSNILPWVRLEKSLGIKVKYIPMDEQGVLDYEAYKGMLTEKTKLVACTHTSNVMGIHTDVKFIIEYAHAAGARVLIDAAQAFAHSRVNVQEPKADFLVFSSHKMFGPTGVGVLYIARHMQNEVEPFEVGGGMVYSVDFHDATWAKPPLRYEAGTPPIAEVYGLGAAIDFLKSLDFEVVRKHEAALTAHLIDGLAEIPMVRILGPIDTLKHSGYMVSFVSSKMHPHDIAAYVDKQKICIRAGHQCAQLLHKRLAIDGSVRVSFALYSTIAQVNTLIYALREL